MRAIPWHQQLGKQCSFRRSESLGRLWFRGLLPVGLPLRDGVLHGKEEEERPNKCAILCKLGEELYKLCTLNVIVVEVVDNRCNKSKVKQQEISTQ